MKFADWSFKLRSFLGAVDDQRYQQELTTTETSSTPRLNATLGSEESALSTQMYHILVMTTAGAALDKCHNAGVNEGFEAWRQFVMEWEPKLRTRYVRLLMNVLGYRFRDDIPTKAGGVRENRARPREPINKNCRRRCQDRSDDAGDGGHASERAEQRQDHQLESDAKGDSRDHANTTVHRQATDAEAARSESEEQRQGQRLQGKGKDVKGKGKAKDAKNESSKKAKSDDQRRCFYCNKSGQMKAECRKRQKDLADAEGRPVASSPHPNDTAAVVPLQCLLPDERHTSTFVTAMLCANSETSCESSSEQAVRSPGANSIPRQKHNTQTHCCDSVNEKYLMMDTCAGASIFQEVLITVRQATRRWHQCNSRRRQTIRCTGMRERNQVLV